MNRGDNYKIFAFALILVILLINTISANVGVGISPLEMRQQIVAGETLVQEFLIYNVGSDAMEITLVARGEIKAFTEIEETVMIVEPEPNPDEFPIENGKIFTVTFSPPRSGSEKTFTGAIVASGKGAGDSQFGGNVGVLSKVELIVVPADSIFKRLTNTHYLILAILIALVIIIIFFRKSGFSIKFEKK